jgi:hypothetical protein
MASRRHFLKSLALALFSLPWLPKILGAQEPEEEPLLYCGEDTRFLINWTAIEPVEYGDKL